MKPGVFTQPCYCHAHRLAAVVLVATACALTGTLANAQSDDLVIAAGRGDLPAVNALLKAGADVNDPKSTIAGPTTALMAASSNGHLAVVQALLAAKADVNAKQAHGSKEGDTALTLASRKGDLAVVQALLAAKADVDVKFGDRTALFEASANGNLDLVRALLAAKADPNSQTTIVGRTPLMQALSSGHWDVARVLVEAGANVNATTPTGVAALIFAAGDSSPRGLAMVKALLAAGADVNGGFAHEVTPRATPAPKLVYSGGGTALGVASSTGSVEVVQALLAANSWVDVNIKQPGGNTPLTIAAAKGRADVVRLLLAAKADVNAKLRDGSTALMLALQNDHPEVASLLTSAGAK